ncbi:MAG: hypothetical protein IT331_13420 [Anaerolineae bacterium]|nr:hypothetical protein [Anaerolineae bacterium]
MQFQDALFPILFWALVLYLFRPAAWRAEDWRDRRVFGARVFALGMAIALTIQAHPIGAYFDALVGVNNLSWFVGYLNAVVAVFAGTSALVIARSKMLPNWLAVVSVGTCVIFVFLVPALISTLEEYHNALPRSLPLLLLRETLYAYIFIISLFCVQLFREWTAEEKHPTGQLRGWILLFAFSSIVVFAVLRGSSALAVYFIPDWEWYDTALHLSDGVLVLCLLAVALGVAPVSWLRIPVRVLGYIEQHRSLRDLERIHRALVRVTGKVPCVNLQLKCTKRTRLKCTSGNHHLVNESQRGN